MTTRISVADIPGIPAIERFDDVAAIIIDAARSGGIQFEPQDIVCVASKVISIAEDRVKALADVQVSEVAKRIHERVPRKDPRTIQVMIDETGAPDGSRLEVRGTHIGAWLPSGLRLTSAGVDKQDPEAVILLPKDPDASARAIGRRLQETAGVGVGVIITDSDGRVEKRGATQVAVGLYGVPPLRVSQSVTPDGKTRRSEETVCDMLAAAAGLIMGQRGTNKPVVLIRGYDYAFSDTACIRDSLSMPA